MPPHLHRAIESLIEGDYARLGTAYADQSAGYRQRGRSRFESPVDVAAYVAARLPATYAAAERVFADVRSRLPAWRPASILDLGCGPGTALFAAKATWPGMVSMVGVDRDPAILTAARTLASSFGSEFVDRVAWRQETMADALQEQPGLVVSSYALGELSRRESSLVLSRLTQAKADVVVVIEPGTPAGFATIGGARSTLIAGGWHIVSPCPTDLVCPMTMTQERWCHFAVRVQRSRSHRFAKGGSLGWEDEPFSYCVATRIGGEVPWGRLVGRPRRRGSLVEAEACSIEGLVRVRVTRRQDVLFKRLAKSRWGDSIDAEPPMEAIVH